MSSCKSVRHAFMQRTHHHHHLVFPGNQLWIISISCRMYTNEENTMALDGIARATVMPIPL